jgi:integrase
VRGKASISNVRLHDLRHMFASWSVMGGTSLHMTGALLGHRQTATTRRYAHLANEPLRAVANKVSNMLAAALRPMRPLEARSSASAAVAASSSPHRESR